MQDNNSETTGNTIDDHAPKPWQQQPQEPPDHFGWFQVYLTSALASLHRARGPDRGHESLKQLDIQNRPQVALARACRGPRR